MAYRRWWRIFGLVAPGRSTRLNRPAAARAARARAVRRPLRRAQVSFALVWTGESAFAVALAVVAFRSGGLAAVGAVTALRMAAAALLTPFLGPIADRVRRETVLTAIGLVRAVALGATALLTAADGAPVATYGCAAVATLALTLYRPAHSALLPALANSPRDLTSANAVRGILDSAATLGGPVAAAAILATSGPPAVFAVCSALSLLGGLVVVALPYDVPPRPPAAREAVARSVLEGFATIGRDRTLSLVAALGVVQTFTRGCLTVFTVVLAVDVLHTGEPGVGVLSSAVGAGGVLGSVCALALVTRGGLGTWFGVGVALFGAPLALLGLVPAQVTAVALLALVGVGNSLIDVSAFTVLARHMDESVLGRTFASFEALLTVGVALGGLAAPLVVQAIGPRVALVAVGLLAPAAVVVRRRALRRLDGEMRVRDADIDVLRAVPMLGVLPAATVEQLAAGLERAQFAPDEVVFEQGEGGDRFFVVESGAAEVVRDGQPVNLLTRGAGFGDVALLSNVPRTATVRASGAAPLCVAVLRRAAFLTAVTGYPASAAAGYDAVAGVRARDTARQRGVADKDLAQVREEDAGGRVHRSAPVPAGRGDDGGDQTGGHVVDVP